MIEVELRVIAPTYTITKRNFLPYVIISISIINLWANNYIIATSERLEKKHIHIKISPLHLSVLELFHSTLVKC